MNKPANIVYAVEPETDVSVNAPNDILPAGRADFKVLETAIQSYKFLIKATC